MSNTPNLSLNKPDHADPAYYDSWDAVINTNMDTIDTAFGPRSYTEKNYIANTDVITASLDKLDMKAKDIDDLTPTLDQKGALLGYSNTPSSTNKYLTEKDVVISSIVTNKLRTILHPKYPGSLQVLTTASPLLAPGANGVLSNDADVQNNYIYGYYKWVNATVSLESCDILVQWKVPLTFVEFEGSYALRVDLCTEDADDTNCGLEVILNIDGESATSVFPSTAPTDLAFGDAGTWMSARESSEVVDFAASDAILDALVAGDTLNIILRLFSKSSKYVKVGAISLYGKW
jgi:hypothetical protein